jgi:hypothetical protein
MPKRLAEAFLNLTWLLKNQDWVDQNPDYATSRAELKFYLSLYPQLKTLDPALEADYLHRAHEHLKSAVAGFEG